MHYPTLRTLADVQAIVPWDQPYENSLENYLRALWKLVQEYRNASVSWSLLGFLLTEAFTTEPLPFEPQWFDYTAPPQRENSDDPYTYLEHMLLYQIADLHRMDQVGTLQLSPLTLYGGVDSPTGHRWYNFATEGYFECAFSGGESWLQSAAGDWAALAELLYLGQIYE